MPGITAEEALRKARADRQELAGELDRKPRLKKGKARRQTIADIERPKKKYPKSAEVAERAALLQEYLDPKEIMGLQRLSARVYEHYLNPAFWIALRKFQSKEDVAKIESALRLFVEQPFEFTYKVVGDDVVEIRKRPPFDKTNSQIPDDFVIRMETDKGYVTRVNKIDLKNNAGGITWFESGQYISMMPHYDEQLESARSNRVDYDKLAEAAGQAGGMSRAQLRQKIIEIIFVEPFSKVPEPLKEFYVENHIRTLERFLTLVDSRDLLLGGVPEKDDPRVTLLRSLQRLQGKTYTELTAEEDSKLQVRVFGDPSIPAYLFYTRTAPDDPIAITPEGYLMVRQPDGSFVKDPRYDTALMDTYKARNPKAQDAYDEVAKMEGRAPEDAKAAKQRAIEQEKQRLAALRSQVDALLTQQGLTKLKEIAKLVRPDATAEIDRFQDDTTEARTKLREIIRLAMGSDKDKIEAVAINLGIMQQPSQVPAATPAAAPKKSPEKTKDEVMTELASMSPKSRRTIMEEVDPDKPAFKFARREKFRSLVFDGKKGVQLEAEIKKWELAQARKWLDEGKISVSALDVQ